MPNANKNTAVCPMHAPSDHPKMKPAKVGVLLANLGTPDGTDYWSMRRYLNEFLSDKRVVDYSAWIWQPLLQLIILTKRPFSSGAAYKSIWNEEADESPLLTITKAQTAAMKERLKTVYGDDVVVDFCMRYGNPSTKSKVQEMVAQGCQKILFFPLYPQYAGAAYIDALAQSIETAYAEADTKPEILVCSYHGVPQRYLTEGDPYHCHCQKTTRLLKERLGWDDTQIVTTFQSRFGPEEWLQPYTVEEVARLAESGKTNIAVCAPAFSADCIETLEEINEEIKESFEEAGGEHFTYIPCLNEGLIAKNTLY